MGFASTVENLVAFTVKEENLRRAEFAYVVTKSSTMIFNTWNYRSVAGDMSLDYAFV